MKRLHAQRLAGIHAPAGGDGWRSAGGRRGGRPV